MSDAPVFVGMTAFAETSREIDGASLQVRIHGVNHRYLDMVVRLPEDLRGLDAKVRERLSQVARRGRLELSASFRTVAREGAVPEIDPTKVAAFLAQLEGLRTAGQVGGTLTAGEVLREPSFRRAAENVPAGAPSAGGEALLELVDEALATFAEGRREEGRRCGEALARIASDLGAALATLRAITPGAQRRLAESLKARLGELLGETTVGDERWLAEAALLAEKGDVREEVDRLGGHLDELGRVLGSGDGGGRRIDFLGQEILRELNTLASKCREVEVVKAALDARLMCEQLREQAQNVE